MAKIEKLNRNIIIEKTLELVRKNGESFISARNLAKSLNCSTQPIYNNFKTMQELKEQTILAATKVYNSYIENSKDKEGKPYKNTGIAYLLFAKNEPNLFKLLFMRDRTGENIPKEMTDDNMEYILQKLMQSTGLNRESAYQFHLNSWIYVHGMASMIATNYNSFSEEQIETLLSTVYLSLKNYFTTK